MQKFCVLHALLTLKKCTSKQHRPPIIKIQDKVMIPQDNHPEVNFIGLLIGPRYVGLLLGINVF